MDKSYIQEGLSKFVEELTSQTYLNTYRIQKRSSLLADGLGTRANSIWKMAHYIIAFCDDDISKPITKYLTGWSELCKNYKDQFLIIETEEKGNWQMYDSYSNFLGGNDYIEHYIKTHNGAKKCSTMKGLLSLQQIYFGAPGTGKSYAVEQITNNNNSIRTTFHPDSDYSTFVGCYKPMQKVGKQISTKISLEKLKEKATEIINQPAGDKVEQIIDFISLYAERLCEIVEEREDVKSLQNLMNIHFGFSNETYLSKMILKVLEERKSNTNEITYAFQPQAFTQAYVKAWQNLNEPFYLVIEEINRGNCAQIFGDIFQLLDRDSDTGYSNYKITPDQDLQMYLANEFANTEIEDVEIKNGVKMQLPGNLHILATMNTSDQSLFPIDSAFKRRWDWKYIPIDYTDLGHYITCGDKKYKWIDFLTEVNKRIEAVTQSEDKKLGAWFVKAVNNEISAEKFVSKVVFYLWNDIYKDLAHDASTVFKGNFDKFHKFFDFKGDVKLDVLDEFFESLEILYFTDDEESVSDKEDSDSKSHLIVQFPDGTKISENTRFETYQKALKIIGLEKAEQVASTMKYKRLNSPLISKTKSENILNNTQGYLYIEDGDFNIIKGINTRTMRRFLMQISDTYNLGINCVVE